MARLQIGSWKLRSCNTEPAEFSESQYVKPDPTDSPWTALDLAAGFMPGHGPSAGYALLSMISEVEITLAYGTDNAAIKEA
jgi:hypothetical protein